MDFVHFDEWFEREFLAIQEKFEIFAKNHVCLRIFSKSLTRREKYDILVRNNDRGDEVHEKNKKEGHKTHHF